MNWFRRRKPAEDPAVRILRLAKMPAAIYAIGDIHGHLGLYDDLEAAIADDAKSIDGPKLIVCLGDIVDRGPQTAPLIDRLMGKAPDGFQRVVLRGNHEDMMTEFLNAPEAYPEWLSYGGAETLSSYGMAPDSEGGFAADKGVLKHKIEMAIPAAHRDFLSNLPCALVVDRLHFAHAGYDLSRLEDKQKKNQLLWGPPEETDTFKGDKLLVHGHKVVPDVERYSNRINLDLGAYKTGRLAAMHFGRNTEEIKVLIAER